MNTALEARSESLTCRLYRVVDDTEIRFFDSFSSSDSCLTIIFEHQTGPCERVHQSRAVALQATFVLPLLEISVMPWSPGKQGAACRQPQSTVRLETLQVRGGRLLRQTSGGCAGPEDAVGPEPLYALGLSIGPLQVRHTYKACPKLALAYAGFICFLSILHHGCWPRAHHESEMQFGLHL